MTTNFVAADRWADAVRVISGAWDGSFLVAGTSVAALQSALADPCGVSPTALSFVNGSEVEPSYRLQANDTLEFILPIGEKGILDPDEKAQLERMEAMMKQLLGDQAKTKGKLAAARGLGGRKSETLEIAEYANELRLQNKTWKEVLSACK